MNDKAVLLCLGANSHRTTNMRMAKACLAELLGDSLTLTGDIQTAPIGGGGADYLNCMATGRTLLTLSQLLKRLKDIENLCGNTTEKRLRGQVEMDIDVLLYDGERHHLSDWQRPYVQRLMQELTSAE